MFKKHLRLAILVISSGFFLLTSCTSGRKAIISPKKYSEEYQAINYFLKKAKKNREDDVYNEEAFDLAQYHIYETVTYDEKDRDVKKKNSDFFQKHILSVLMQVVLFLNIKVHVGIILKKK